MIYLGLGSNLSSRFGDRFKNINLAISYLEESGIKVIKKSSFYETPSYPDIQNPKFINMVVHVETIMPPLELMSTLILVEEKLERKRFRKNDPRTCDIDIVDYNSQILNLKSKNFEFSVPHKKLTLRNFVLFPLKEICPEWIHPLTRKNIDDLIEQLSEIDKKSILKVQRT